jgi:hypothetical protein
MDANNKLYYHATPKRNLKSIGRLGLLSGKRVLELGVGELTIRWQDGAPYIHVCDNIDDCAHWIQWVGEFSKYGCSWYIIRFDQSAAGVEARLDPKSHTGLILETDCIPPEHLAYRFGEDYLPGQGEEIAGMKVWTTMNSCGTLCSKPR